MTDDLRERVARAIDPQIWNAFDDRDFGRFPHGWAHARDGSLFRADAAIAAGVGVGWRPIETAPKDGTRVLLYGGRGILIGYWNVNPKVWDRDIIGCWTIFEPDDYFYADHLIEDGEAPTHWMPLPAPPSSPETGEAETAPASTEKHDA